MVKVSAIGIGMRSHAGVAARAFKALAEKGVNIRAITTSEIKFSVLIDAALYRARGADPALALWAGPAIGADGSTKKISIGRRAAGPGLGSQASGAEP